MLNDVVLRGSIELMKRIPGTGQDYQDKTQRGYVRDVISLT